MNTDMLIVSASVSGLIGILAPFLLPKLFVLLGKIFKKDLSTEEKRLSITILSVIIAFVVILVSYEWSGDIKGDVKELVQFLFVNYVAIKAMIQTIYELVIKTIPALNERFS